MPENEEILPEVVIKKANTKDGNVGWDIRLQRLDFPKTIFIGADGKESVSGGPETDEEYFARIVAMYERCWQQWGKESANG